MKKFIIFMILCLLVAMGYFYYKSHAVVQVTNNPVSTQGGSNQTAALEETIQAISQFMVLPLDDTPALAVVSDPKALTGQAFFKESQVGDRVLVYPKARMAILYRPSIHKIIQIEAAPTATSSSTVVQ